MFSRIDKYKDLAMYGKIEEEFTFFYLAKAIFLFILPKKNDLD
jgi:hypothetical protein